MFLRLLLLVALVAAIPDCCLAGPHQRLVRQSGITPRKVGTHEGVGMSTRSHIDARNNACYWGQRTPVSVQYSTRYSKRGQPLYYAVVRYR